MMKHKETVDKEGIIKEFFEMEVSMRKLIVVLLMFVAVGLSAADKVKAVDLLGDLSHPDEDFYVDYPLWMACVATITDYGDASAIITLYDMFATDNFIQGFTKIKVPTNELIRNAISAKSHYPKRNDVIYIIYLLYRDSLRYICVDTPDAVGYYRWTNAE